MDNVRTLLLFCLAIISADLAPNGGFPALTNALPGTNSGYGIMGTTDEEESARWAKEQEEAFKKLEKDWNEHKISGSAAGESGSGSGSEKFSKPFKMEKNRLGSKELNLGHKRQMPYGMRSYAQIDASGIINQAVSETIQENTTNPPPMPPTMPKTTRPVEPDTNLPNINPPPSLTTTMNEVSQSATVQGPGKASSSVNVKGVGGQSLSIKTSQTGPNGDKNKNYNVAGPKPGMPVSLHLANNISSIDIINANTTNLSGREQSGYYGFYSGNGSSQNNQQSSTFHTTMPDLTQATQVQPTTITPLTAVNQDTNSITASYPYGYNTQSQTDQNIQPPITSATNSNQGEGYAYNSPSSNSSSINLMTANGNIADTNNGSASNQPSLSIESSSNYYLGGVHINNSSYISGQQSRQVNPPTKSTIQWWNPTQSQAVSQNLNPSVTPTHKSELTSGSQNSYPVPNGFQTAENQKPSFSIKFQTEVANPTMSKSQQGGSLNIKPVKIGRVVTQDKDGGLIISSSSIYEIGRDLFNPASSYQPSFASNTGESNQSMQQGINVQESPNNAAISSPTNKASSVQTQGIANQQNQPTKPTISPEVSQNVSPTPPSWLPTYSLPKSLHVGLNAPNAQPDQATAEASINISEIIIPKDGYQRLPVMVMQPPSTEKSPTVMPPPIPLIDKGSSQGQVNESNNQSPTQLPNLGPIQGPTQSQTQAQNQKPNQGPSPTTGASTSMFSFGSNPTVVGTVNPTAGISTATSKIPSLENGTSSSVGQGNSVGNITNDIQDSASISLLGSQDDELTSKELENMMQLEENEEKLSDDKDSPSDKLAKSDEKVEDATQKKPTQAIFAQAPTADPYGGVKDALLAVDIAQLRPGELLSLRLPNSQTSDIFKVKDIKSNDDVSAYSSDLENDSTSLTHTGPRDKKHILYAIIEKVKNNKNYRNAMRTLFSTGDRRSWKTTKNAKKSGKALNGNSKTIDLPKIAILRSYSKDEIDKKDEKEFAKLLQENIGPEIVDGKVYHDKGIDGKKGKDANKLRSKLLSVEAKMQRLHRKSSIRGSKRSGIRHSHGHYKKASSDVNGSKKTEGTFEVSLKISDKKKDGKNKEEQKSKEDTTEENDEPKLEPGKTLKFKGTFNDGRKKEEKEKESKDKKIPFLPTQQTSQGLKPQGKPGNVIIEDENGNVLYKGPVDITALNQTVAKNGGNGTGFQLQNVGYRVDPSANSEESVILKQGLEQAMPSKRSERHNHHPHHHKHRHIHSRRRFSRSAETKKDVKATKKTEGTFKLMLKASGKPKDPGNQEEKNKEGKDDVYMNDSSHELFNDGKELTFKGTFTDGKDPKGEKDENKEKKKQGKEEKAEEEEEGDMKKKKRKKGEKQLEEEEAEEEEEGEEKEKKKKEKEKEKTKENEKNNEKENKEKEKEENKEKSPEKEFSSKNSQGNPGTMQSKENTTNVIIEDSKGTVLYKGPVDVAALNKTVSNKNGSYSGFHLESAGYRMEDSANPQEMALINDGLQHAIHANSGRNIPQQLQPKRRRRRFIVDDQPSKKTDGTFTLTLSVNDKKRKKENKTEKKPEKEDDKEKENKPGYVNYSDFEQKDFMSHSKAKTEEKHEMMGDDKTTSEKPAVKEGNKLELLKSVSPHVIIEDEHGQPLYQGPVDITALNKSVASKGGSINYELQNTGYQLVKDPYQNEPASQYEAMGIHKENVLDDSSKSINRAEEEPQIKQQTDSSDVNVIKTANNGPPSSGINQEEQNVSLEIANDGQENLGQKIQPVDTLKTTSKTVPFNNPSSKHQQPKNNRFLLNDLTGSIDSKEKPGKLKTIFLPGLNKEEGLKQSVNNGEMLPMQDQIDEKDIYRGNTKEKMFNSKIPKDKSGSDEQSTSFTANSFVDTIYSKLLHKYGPKSDLSKNRTLKEHSKDEQNLVATVSSDETLQDGSNSESNAHFKSKATPSKIAEANDKKIDLNVQLTKTQNGGSSIGGKILQTRPVMDEIKAPDRNEGSDNEKAMANMIPTDEQVKESDGNSLNDVNQNGQINPKNVAFLTPNVPPAVQMKGANMKAPLSRLPTGQNRLKNSGKHFPKKYQVLRLTKHKLKELKELLRVSANADKVADTGKDQQMQYSYAATIRENPKKNEKNENKAEQTVTLVLSGPYLDQLEGKNDSLRQPSLPNNQLKAGNQTIPNQLNMTLENMKDVNTLSDPEGRNVTNMLPNEILVNDDDKILIGEGGKSLRPAPSAEGVFKSQQSASGLNVLLKTPDTQNPAFLVQNKDASSMKIPSSNPQGMGALPTISVLSGSGQRVDCHALPAGSSLTLLKCGPNDGPTVSTLSKAQAASMLGLTGNDLPQNAVPQHELSEPDVLQNIMGAPDLQMNDEPQPGNHQVSAKPGNGYGVVTNPSVYQKMSNDIKDYLDKEIDDEKSMIQNLLLGSSTPRASLPSQNNDDSDDAIPLGFAYIPGAAENNLYNIETRNPNMYQGFPNEYINPLSNQDMSRRHHTSRMFRSRYKHRNTRRSKIHQRPGPWKRTKSSKKGVRRFPIRHWSFRRIFAPPIPLLIRPLYPQPWMLTKRCCGDGKSNDKDKTSSSKSSKTTTKNDLLPTSSPASMGEWEYLGRVLCSCPCCIECVDW